MIEIKAKAIHIKGLVQGVGFRPFIYRLAVKNNIFGWVKNGNDGVRIHAEGQIHHLELFICEIESQKPAAAQIYGIAVSDAEIKGFVDFKIKQSRDYSDEITDISPDIAVCSECLADMKNQANRIDYPFVNCTNCGPRFTIIRDLPYDRNKTTMEPFKMCTDCQEEYRNILDRRFHAQPVACIHCGPIYELIIRGKAKITNPGQILHSAAELIHTGKIVAIKGMGGFHLACDAGNESAVSNLRFRKNREGKPFAVMFRSLDSIKEFLEINETEEIQILSWQRPIVILQNLHSEKQLAASVSNNFKTTGAMLPYMPLHYLLFEHLNTPAIVFTSGNTSDEPVIIDNQQAFDQLDNIADAFLVYNRDIYNRADDSVVMVAGEESRLIRRSRGYAPSPANITLDAEGIFAAGAELVNCFCIGKGKQAIMSQHIGDLQNLETLSFYTESFSRFQKLFRQRPSLIVCDLHPDYLSTRFAIEYALKNNNLPLIKVQHHHAHLTACMAEHGLDEKVIGVSMDGVGYGTDGNIWGFECMTCDLLDFERNIHLDYVQQPGGDLATKQPWRMALAYLYRYIDHDFENLDIPFIKTLNEDQVRYVKIALDHGINTPRTSSAGRLFDAVSALISVCSESSFHAEAPMRLENIADWNSKGKYEFLINDFIDPGPAIRQILDDIRKGTPPSVISARFHRGLAHVVVNAATMIKERTGLCKVVLSGGTFQNKYLLASVEETLRMKGFKVFSPRLFPVNDGGIALGQLIIAAKRKASGLILQSTDN